MIRKYKISAKSEVRAPNDVAAWKNSGGALFHTKKRDKDSSEALAHYKKMSDEAEKEYKRAGETIKKETDEKLRRAAVDYELLKKYLPTQNEQAGLSGLGVSESTLIEARNGYAGRVGKIESEGDAAREDLDRAYRAEKKELLGEYLEKRESEEAIARAEKKEADEILRRSQDFVYENTVKMLTNEQFSSFEELDELLKTAKPRVREEQYEQLLAYVNYYKKHPDYAEWDRKGKEG